MADQMTEMSEQERNPDLTYCEGGLHTITGVCRAVNETHSIYTIISDDDVIYNIRIGLITGYEVYPKQQYPKLMARCVVKAEQLYYFNNDGYYDSKYDGYYEGYSEHSYIPDSDKHEVELVKSGSYVVVNAS